MASEFGAGGVASSEAASGLGYGTRLRAALHGVAAIVAEFEPERFRGTDAERLTEMFAWGERLCATGKALAAARVAETGAWQASGERCAADWLGRVSEQTSAAAAGTLDTAKRYRSQPDVEAAARAGKLSESQSAAVSGAAAVAPEAAGELLDEARDGTLTELRHYSRRIRLAAEEAAEQDRHQAIHAGRYFRTWTDDEGAGRLTGRLTADALAAVVSALAPFHEEILGAARAAGRRERRECYAADALVAMARAATGQDPPTLPATGPPPALGRQGGGAGDSDCESGLAGDPGDLRDPGGRDPGSAGGGPDCESGPAGDPGDLRLAGSPDDSGARGGDSAGAARAGVRRAMRPATVIVRIDHAALVRGWRRAEECCEIDGIGLVPVASVRAMMSDAFLAAVVTDGVDIRSVAHLGRAVTARQRTALLARDPICVIPGCDVRRGLEIDHVEDWAATRVTRVDSLARICAHHHRQKTYEGWRLAGPPGQWTWTGPDRAGRDHTSPDRHDQPEPSRGPLEREPDAAGLRPATTPVSTSPASTLFDPANGP